MVRGVTEFTRQLGDDTLRSPLPRLRCLAACCVALMLAAACARDNEATHADERSTPPHTRNYTTDAQGALDIAARVFEQADWNAASQLDHLELIRANAPAAFKEQTEALANHSAGYLCAGTATYLSYVLSQRGYLTALYNSGVGTF